MKKNVMTRESIQAIFNPMVDLLVKKNEDYHGASFDLGPTGNFVHIWDKVSRLKHLFENRNNGKAPNFESIEDTYRDIIGYCVIGLHIMEQDKRGNAEVDADQLIKDICEENPSTSPTLIEHIVKRTAEALS